jgi:hypothetical protein
VLDAMKMADLGSEITKASNFGIDLGLSGFSQASNIAMVDPALDAMQKMDLGLAMFGSDYASKAAGLTNGLESRIASDYSALTHLDEKENYPTNLRKSRLPELRLIKPDHSIREDLLLSIKNQDSISRNYIYETLKLLTLCNDAAIIAMRMEIFKPTNKVIGAILDLPQFVPKGKEEFGQFIDNLYTIFYEGAGDDKPRFLKENGGVLERSDCEFIWCFKHLRNKWLRHDPDHGNEKKVNQSRQSLREAFDWLGLNHMPTESEDFVYMHSKLSKGARKFLECLLEKSKEMS